MKVDFTTVRPYSVAQTRSVQKNRAVNTTQNVLNTPQSSFVRISFKGNSGKNFSQVASIAAEDKGMGIPEYSQGGLGVVAKELPESLNSKGGMDSRTFVPYHTYGADGRIRVLKIEHDETGKRIDKVDPTKFRSVGLDYKLKEGESFVIQSKPNKGLSRFVEIQAIGVKGEVSRLSPTSLEEEKVPYHIFKVVNQPKNDGVTRYVVHTPTLATFDHSYGGSAYGAYSSQARAMGAYAASASSDAAYGENVRAVVDALPKLSQKEGFNPGNILAHDRTAFPAIADIVSRSANGESYFTEMRIDGRFHNPGRTYQGFYDDALSFFRVVAGKHEIEALKKSPAYAQLKELEAKVRTGRGSIEDRAKIDKILRPYLQGFVDDFGTYNITKIPLQGTFVNPDSMTAGTVSKNYGFEIANSDTRDMAAGLTKTFAKAKLINITNGSAPASLRIDDPEAEFGGGGNTLSEKKAGFTTYAPKFDNEGKVTNIDEILKAKQGNKKWLIDLIADAAKSEDKEALQAVFFKPEDIHPPTGRPSTVLGSLSHYEEGDKLLIGWGRPDPQKGFPTTFEGFLKFLKDPTISEETKRHTKLIVGAGPNTWDDMARDWKNIRRLYEEITSLDNGRYRGNVMYVNGMFPNRLAGCADYSIFTSVYEPCGITPFESYTAGSPVTSIKTGGAPDFIRHHDGTKAVTDETGILTKSPYLLNHEDLGITKEQLAGKTEHERFEIIDDARRAKSSDEVASCIKQAVTTNEQDYRRMAANAMEQKNEWHNNVRANGGVSALDQYKSDIFEVDPKTTVPTKPRSKAPLKNLFGAFGDLRDKVVATFSGSNTTAAEEVADRLNDATDQARATSKQLEVSVTSARDVITQTEVATARTQEATKVANQVTENLTKATAKAEQTLDRANGIGSRIRGDIRTAKQQAENVINQTKELLTQSDTIVELTKKNLKTAKIGKVAAGIAVGATAVSGVVLYLAHRTAQKIVNSRK